MASINISENPPHFFKFLLQNNIQQGNLIVPQSFTRKHGKDLSDTVLIRVPSGAEWQVKSTTSNGVWTLHGLLKFMEFYQLQMGHFLLFRFLGKSSFWVVICDKSATEIEYPLHDCVQEEESASEIEYPVHDSNTCVQEDAEEGEGFMKHEISGTPKPLIASKKSRALEIANSFKSKNPFFVVYVQPSYICNRFRLNIPLSFITKYFLKDDGYLNLHCSNGGPWRVKFIRYNSRAGNNPKVEFSEGWKEFAQDNTLGVGDVCVFELNKGRESSLEVVIYRSREDGDGHDFRRMKMPKMEDTGDSIQAVDDFSPGRKALGKTSSTCLRPQKMSTTHLGTQTKGMNLEKPKRKRGLSFGQDLEGGGHMATGKRRLVSGIPKKRTAFRCSETDRAFQMAKSLVQPESPFFMASHAIRQFRLHIPRDFFLKHFPNKDHGDVILLDSNGTTWSVKYGSRTSQNCTPRVEFTNGWKEFMQEHDLEAGDTCVFEMINSIKFTLKVTILRVNQYGDGNLFERRKGIEIEESEDDVSTEILGDFSPCKTGEKTSSSMYGSRDKEGGGIMASGQRWLNHDISGSLKPLSRVASKKSRALQMATCFKSKNPFFLVSMQPSHVSKGFRLCIPTSFVTKHFLKDHDYLNLHGSKGGPWQVKYVRYSEANNNHRVSFTSGWKGFAQDNKLVAGDVCVFELKKSSESSLEVVIYRSHDDAHFRDYTCDDDDVQVLDGKTPLTCPRPEKMNTIRSGTQSNGVKPKRKLGQQDLEEGTNPRRTTALSSSEKDRALQMTASLVKPESPFFVIVMQPSYVIRGLRLQIPRAFVLTHFGNKDHGDIILWDSHGGTWPVKYGSRTALNCSTKIELTHGWTEFMQEHDLEVGDVCVFELIDSIKCLFEVTVLQVNQYADGHHFERKKVIKTKESEDDKVLDDKKGENKTSTSSMHGSRDNLTHKDRVGDQRSEHPCFYRTMCWEYLHNALTVPRGFARKYIKETSRPVQLQVADKSWVVQAHIFKDGSSRFSRFSTFARENSLREGDECVFELIKSNKHMLFKVSIVRCIAYDK